jgi:hypothetical protein
VEIRALDVIAINPNEIMKQSVFDRLLHPAKPAYGRQGGIHNKYFFFKSNQNF